MADLDTLLSSKSAHSLLETVIAETAKCSNEIRCAKRDIQKAESRLSFLTVVANELINRTGDLK